MVPVGVFAGATVVVGAPVGREEPAAAVRTGAALDRGPAVGEPLLAGSVAVVVPAGDAGALVVAVAVLAGSTTGGAWDRSGVAALGGSDVAEVVPGSDVPPRPSPSHRVAATPPIPIAIAAPTSARL